MEEICQYTEQLSFSTIMLQVTKLGEDYHIILQGGSRPHVGCTVLAVPRPSLSGDGSISVTSSVLNVTGHKDEEICRYIAEQVSRRKGAVTVCTGGFHADQITQRQIREVMEAVEKIEKEI